MKIAEEPPEEFHDRMAIACDKAAQAYASELSTTRDPVYREYLGKKARQQKEQAQWHRDFAAKLRSERD